MSDINVRRAISLAINRQNINDTLYEGSRTVADGLFPSLIDDSKDNIWPYAKYDPEAAKKIVKDNNLTGTELVLSYNTGGGHEDLMTIILGDLEKVGFKVKQNTLEWAAYLSKLGDGSISLGRLGWNADYPTMDNFVYPNFYPRPRTTTPSTTTLRSIRKSWLHVKSPMTQSVVRHTARSTR